MSPESPIFRYQFLKNIMPSLLDGNGDYNIFIGDRLSDHKKKETLSQEMSYIKKGRFSDTVKASQAEKEV